MFEPQQMNASTEIGMSKCVAWAQNSKKINKISELFDCLEVRFEQSDSYMDGDNLKIQYQDPPLPPGKKAVGMFIVFWL